MSDMLTARRAASAGKELPYNVNGARAEMPAKEDGTPGGHIGRGVNRKSGAPFLIFQDGRTQQALPLGAVAQAIFTGVITPAEVTALQKEAADAAKEAAK